MPSTAETADDGDALLQPVVVGQIELESERSSGRRVIDKVDPEQVAAIYQKMLGSRGPHPKCDRRKREHAVRAFAGCRNRARREHARVDGR